MMDHQDEVEDLENKISLATGVWVGPSANKIINPTENAQFLLRQWLETLGVPTIRAQGMRPEGLINSYAAGREWVKTTLTSEVSQRRTQAGGRAAKGGMDLTGFGQAESRGAKVGELLGAPQAESQKAPEWAPETPEESQKGWPQPPTQDQTTLDRLAEQRIQRTIAPRVEAIKKDLTEYNELQAKQLSNRIDGKVRDAVASASRDFTLSDKTQARIGDIGREAALAAIRENLPHRLEIKLPNGKTHDLPAEPRHKAFETILKRLARRQHVYMVGDAGTGKTHLFGQLGAALDQPVTVLGPSLTKYEFSGHLGPTGEYVTTELRKAVEQGHLLCFDEFDGNSGQAMLFLNTLSANRYITFPNGRVEAHENFRIIAAANTYGHGASRKYINRNPMDEATLDRFAYVIVDYDENLETQIFGTHPWVEYVHRVRKALDELGQSHVVSMRAIERGISDLLNGDDPKEVAFAQLWRGLDQDTIQKIENLAGTFGLFREVA